MSRPTLVSEAVARYVTETMVRETPLQKELRAETAKLREGQMQIGADQGALFSLLLRAIGARRALEIGSFTGYSGLAIASALPADGKLVCCDMSEEWTTVARRYWTRAGVMDRIDLRLGPAQTTLDGLVAQKASFDFAFIDADKTGYDGYYESCLKLVRPGGLIAIDNVLWSQKVVDPSVQDEETVALRALNLKVREDGRVEAVMLTVGDGILLVRVLG
jgi:predicted O-methyltransferase YrrM